MWTNWFAVFISRLALLKCEMCPVFRCYQRLMFVIVHAFPGKSGKGSISSCFVTDAVPILLSTVERIPYSSLSQFHAPSLQIQHVTLFTCVLLNSSQSLFATTCQGALEHSAKLNNSFINVATP